MLKDKIKNGYVTKTDIDRLGTDLRGNIKNLRSEMQDDMKGLRKEINDDFKHHVGVLYEKFHGDMKLVIEYQQGMGKRLARVENKVDLLTETVADIKVEVTGNRMELGNKVDKSEYKGLEKRVVALEVKS